ncbi:helix-hairpin-helix domain-containing protein [Algoriphagus sp.]|uniref:helix-hairpin-helix domain-containing protein n=1 Tax=Algoriphagus sp. TaxID=1872435 RepID=UPI0027168E71|nr:helix-hairpin-helix domain-containing protein [Algoriphagus sp.]MDO8967404.1 helix-hairpin-helix domain-containing protein [Algoriphagus sp.]MDP3198341.1 helix-hairpin-helix domain-containing protein [Algoriphagus sp.]
MKSKTNIKLPLTATEKTRLRKHKIKIANILDFAKDELEVLLQASTERAKEIYALAEFQTVPSVGIKFAEDLVFLGYYSLSELKDKDGAKLTDEYELKKGYWTDPCVEDQFRLIVYAAKTNDQKKTWWDFTAERKKFRAENGYPESRPQKAWFEILGYGGKDKKGSHSGA